MELYNGPAQVVATNGDTVASAHVGYSVRTNPRTGMLSWRGTLTEIHPEHSLEPSQYELRLPDGRQGTILISNLRVSISNLRQSLNSSERATFVGSGPNP